MINFFRKIRFNLLAKSKTGRYFKYAIGEILLVVVGILIAIQLNEWKKERNNNNHKQSVLKALQLDFKANLQQLDTTLFYIEKVPKAYTIANEMIKAPFKRYTENHFTNLITDLSWSYTFNPHNGALRSAISSSEIHLIKNKRLIEILFSWEDVVKDSDEEAFKIQKFQYDSMSMKGKYISSIHDWKSIFKDVISPVHSSNFKGLLQDVWFENYSIQSFAYAKEYLLELNNIKSQNIEILLLINEELKN